jgi:hypothetical protein
VVSANTTCCVCNTYDEARQISLANGPSCDTATDLSQ